MLQISSASRQEQVRHAAWLLGIEGDRAVPVALEWATRRAGERDDVLDLAVGFLLSWQRHPSTQAAVGP